MSSGNDESDQVKIARMDERIAHIHQELPRISKKVDQHDRDILAAKIVACLSLIFLTFEFPTIADAILKVIK